MSTAARAWLDALFVVDAAGVVHDANDVARAASLRAGADPIGRPVGDVVPGVSFVNGVARVDDGLALQTAVSPMQPGRFALVLRSTSLHEAATLERVAASVTHGLRNSLGAVRNATHWLGAKMRAAGAIDARTDEFLGIIDLELRRSNNVIGDLLALSTDRAPHKSAVDVRRLVEEAFRHVPVPTPGPQLENAVAPDLPLIDVDAQQVRHALTAVVQNAVEATHIARPAGGLVRVTAERGDGLVHVDVQDQGAGVPAGMKQDLFRALFTTKLQGTGFGLAIVDAVARRHGGAVSVSDAPGGGALFRMSFPMLAGLSGEPR